MSHFLHSLGSMDGGNAFLQATVHSGCEFYIYHEYFSIELFTLIDANNNYWPMGAGDLGRISVGGVYQNILLKKRWGDGSLDIPNATTSAKKYVFTC
ncbi:hypothetical protein PR048_013880 [Dryococelus australis]|uniref:Dirigent protein n=1 Tax=Dryococelus australis TaxID=614101 RepID=A0ABQ9HTV3_9NEOP|nr:hypothetical protein PR048_013880 [Dryococelus australis]